MNQISYTLSLLLILVLGSCKTPKEVAGNEPKIKEDKPAAYTKWNPKTPKNVEEFRAAWVATVANINWPSGPGLSTSEQQREALELLDFLEAHNFNAVILQVRPQADALFASELEPWSYYLTGNQGQAPDPYYDPLTFWTTAAHHRGLELHVWLNPYRAHHTAGMISEQSVVRTNPELVVELENGMWWMDPAKKGTQERSVNVVMDLVRRYDIDGVHFDDYFYPYDSYNNGKDFPDEESWLDYLAEGGKLSRGDWRRENVNAFIQRLYRAIKAEKVYVKFGLSPFGIWRPGFPESVTGYDQYEKLYADARRWLNEGWIDYFTPQLYWQVNSPGQSFPELLGWWDRENKTGRHLWPGLKVGLGGGEKNIDETINQLMITRGMLPKSKGAVHWSIGSLVKYPELSAAIMEGPYRRKSLVPPSPWLDNEPPLPPEVYLGSEKEKIRIEWSPQDQEDVFRWVVYYKYEEGKWDHKILPGKTRNQYFQRRVGEEQRKLEKIGLTAVDRSGNQSHFLELDIH